MNTHKQENRFVVKKYVMAKSAMDAIKKERKIAVHDVWLDEEWMKKQSEEKDPAIGYEI